MGVDLGAGKAIRCRFRMMGILVRRSKEGGTETGEGEDVLTELPAM